MESRITTKIHEIANVLFRDMKGGKLDSEGIGLLAGQTGIVIFCKHYLQAFPDSKKESILDEFLEMYFDKLTSKIRSFTYCSGLIGALEGLRYLNKEGLLEVDYSDVENNYKNILQEYALLNISYKNYDYLHGSLGVVKYFYHDSLFVNQILSALESTAEKQDNVYKWISSLGFNKGFGYNICLSHGMSSIISVLSLLTDKGIDREKRDRIITNTCNYILSQEIDHNQHGVYFPSQSLENDPKEISHYSRLAWCYGDLGVATSLWQAGKTLKNQIWQEKALEVLRFSASRKDLKRNSVVDAGLCHGAGSICMMFHYIYTQTGEQIFKESRDYWIDITLNLGHRKDGLGGYSVWHYNEEKEWVNEYNLLEGISGIGLLLLSYLMPEIKQIKWLSFFMLN